MPDRELILLLIGVLISLGVGGGNNSLDPKGPFLYSNPISMPTIENTDFLLGVRRAEPSVVREKLRV